MLCVFTLIDSIEEKHILTLDDNTPRPLYMRRDKMISRPKDKCEPVHLGVIHKSSGPQRKENKFWLGDGVMNVPFFSSSLTRLFNILST